MKAAWFLAAFSSEQWIIHSNFLAILTDVEFIIPSGLCYFPSLYKFYFENVRFVRYKDAGTIIKFSYLSLYIFALLHFPSRISLQEFLPIKNFPTIFPIKTVEKISHGDKSTRSQISYPYSLGKHIFSSISWKYRQVLIWLKFLNPARYP